MSSDWHQQVPVVVVTGSRRRSRALIPFLGGRILLPISNFRAVSGERFLPVVIVSNVCSSTANSVLISLLISLPRGDAGLMRGIRSPQNIQKIEQAVEISHLLKELRWKGPCSTDSGMSRMQIIHRLGLGRGTSVYL